MDRDEERQIFRSKIPELFKLVDQNKEKLIDSLKEPVSIPSVSNDPDHSEDILKMLKFCSQKLTELGASVQMIDGHDQNNPNLPPVIFASLFVSSDYKTICIYGNIDTASPVRENYDDQSPFEINRKDERLYACGISDNKAPLFCWINAIEIFKKSETEIPVNIKFIIEGSSEMYSKSLLNAIKKNRKFFENVEFLCLTIDTKKRDGVPCLKYGYRGFCHFSLTVMCGEKRVHGGTYGGAFHQPLLDAVQLVGSLIDKNGKILIPEFLKDIKEITKDDYERCSEEYCPVRCAKKATGLKSFTHKEIPTRLVMHKTRLPSLTVNAFHIKGPLADVEDLSSIPNKIDARFSVRLVPNQTVTRTYEQFKKYIQQMYDQANTENHINFELRVGFNPWLEDPTSEHFKAAEKAIEMVHNTKPNYMAEGTSMPVVSILSAALPGTSIIVMPISGFDDSHHSNSESISIDDYLNGTKLAIAYMCEIHELGYF